MKVCETEVWQVMSADILLLEDDHAYVKAAQAFFTSHHDAYLLNLHPAADIPTALALCREHDVRVAIIDIALTDGRLGTDAISEIWKFDKKIVFIIHTISSQQVIAERIASLGVPYTSQFFLQKSGMIDGVFTKDAGRLYEITLKALRSYVPHIPPSLVSVREVTQVIDSFSDLNPSFRRAEVISNVHHSQDVLNDVSRWASDRLARFGFDSTRIAVVMTGSFARLEATTASDADYFVVFDDSDLQGDRLAEVINIAYDTFVQVGLWFERKGVPVHAFQAEERRPERISWHTTVLPTWFPLNSFLKTKLGRSTQLELTKQWFLLESSPIFNAELVNNIRHRIASDLGILSRQTVRDAITHSALTESYHLLNEEFEYSFRHRRRDSLSVVKHYFMRLLNLLSIRLWLLRCFLDPTLFDSPPDALFRELSPHPLVRVIQFYSFLKKGNVLQGRSLKQGLAKLEKIYNLYAEAAPLFGADDLRHGAATSGADTVMNDLADSGKKCEQHMLELLDILRNANSIASHPEITSRKLLSPGTTI